MANPTSKTGNLEAMLLKIGIPLAISAAGGICAIMMAKGSFPSTFLNPLIKSKSKPNKNENFQSHNHTTPISLEIDEVLVSLRSRVEEIERKEMEIEKQFVWYQNLKEREALLLEVKNTLVMDMANISLLEKEILLMEEQTKRFECLVTEYLGVIEQVEGHKMENKLLEKQVNTLKKRLKEQSKIIRDKNLKIKETKTEIWRNNEEIETKKKIIEKLGNEVRELKIQMAQLQQQNIASSSFKMEEEKQVRMEDLNKLSNEFNQLKEEFEVLRKHEQKEEDQNESSCDQTKSSRPKLLQRISCVGSNEKNQKIKRKIRPQ